MKIVMNMDYYDDVLTSETPYDETKIEQFMRQCRDNGVEIVHWRLSICGKLAYPSKVRAEDVFREGPSNVAGDKMRAILESFDPLEAAVRLGHQYGIKIYAWITVMDEYYMRQGDTIGLESEFVIKHPKYTWISRDGQHHMLGAICYDYLEVVEHRLREIEEVLTYDIDGLYLCTRSHAKHSIPVLQDDYYGYNEPWVRKYKERYGVDVRTEAFDSDLLSEIRGESFTEFLRLASERVRRKGIPLIIGLRKSKHEAMNMYPYAKMFYDWQKWVKEDIVDEVSMCAGEDFHDQTPEWLTEIAEEMADYCLAYGKKMNVWMRMWDWSNKYSERTAVPCPTKPAEVVRDILRTLASYPKLNTVALHEALNVEHHNLWADIDPRKYK
ncbi:hypothetical protein [Paenibacillus nasutitermitis]|uniref:Glycosyl hydrolase-like 10 domain-containing protein n=1 Tax=Paenibacillus nasutitermitis TaxID=1652958 RepID=A0A916YNQ1_9BACL|nr:hypothetical protein [Paenibacillus nasutitermitis]GGD51891.1 hypothetical protein GCM10010911_06840 [Paenibacillus nasutitermitis]